MSNIFFTSDLHIGHKRILEFCRRPFRSIQEHDELLIRNWNATVQANDEVYILGDFVFAEDQEAVEKIAWRLNGKKYLILGNHDQAELCESSFDWVKDYYILEALGLKWVLFHFPLLIWWKQATTVHLYGHIHNRGEREPKDSPFFKKYEFLKRQERCFNVGVDVNGFAPVPIKNFVKKLSGGEK